MSLKVWIIIAVVICGFYWYSNPENAQKIFNQGIEKGKSAIADLNDPDNPPVDGDQNPVEDDENNPESSPSNDEDNPEQSSDPNGCPSTSNPVCGDDGITYKNSCYAQLAEEGYTNGACW